MDQKSIKPYISVVIPVYGCPDGLEELYERLVKSIEPITTNFELILVNDASPDRSWEIIQKLALDDARVLGVNLSRNFGQHPAIFAGLKHSSGDWVVVMDCDLQDPPEEIQNLHAKALEGFEQVVAVRRNRQDSGPKKFFSKAFRRVLGYLSAVEINQGTTNFGIYSRKLITILNNHKEHNQSFGLFVSWIGFSRFELETEHSKRVSGKSSYSFSALLRHGLISVIGFSDRFLILIVKLGFLLSGLSFLWALEIVVSSLVSLQFEPGWPSLMVVMLLSTGLVIISIGIVGLYVGQVLSEAKNRPSYIVADITRTEAG